MWETLTRRHLFKRDTDFLTFQAITGDPIEDVCVQRPDVPPALSAVIMKALSRDREERFPTARILGEAIASACQPFTGSAISEEIARAFPAELGEQAALIRVAREGGAFDLDLDRGPSVGHGAELLTTPVSSQRAFSPGDSTSVTAIASPVRLGSRSGVRDSAKEPPAAAAPAAPVPVLRRSWRPLVIAALALAVGGIAAYIYGRVSHEPAPAPGSGTTVVGAGAEPQAARPKATGIVAVDAAPAQPAPPPPSDAPQIAAPQIAAPSIAAPPAVTQPDRPPAKPPMTPAVAKPSGPPGFITIDSAPVYAVIYIDGKNYGETPLVKLALPPGRHGVHAVAPSGATRDVHITIESGKVAPASRIEW